MKYLVPLTFREDKKEASGQGALQESQRSRASDGKLSHWFQSGRISRPSFPAYRTYCVGQVTLPHWTVISTPVEGVLQCLSHKAIVRFSKTLQQALGTPYGTWLVLNT